MLKIEKFSCGYGDKTIIKNFNAIFNKGEVTAIVGNSGKGKTTLLKAINRLHEVEENSFFKNGTIKITLNNNEQDIDKLNPIFLRRKVGYIFQSPTPLPMSIVKNVSFGLELLKIKDKSKVIKALKDVYLWDELKDRLDENANSLSLGQQQRLAIARTLVLEPEIILFDEPTSSLDEKATLKIEALINNLKKDKTIIFVTHDKLQIKRLCDREVVI